MTSPSDTDRLWATIHHERGRLLDLLRSLDPADWDRPSLCTGWRVRDVAAHAITSSDYSLVDMVTGVIRARGDFDRLMDRLARTQGSAPIEQIMARYERQATSRRRPPGTKPADPLVDVLVHSQDIAIPLGREHPMPTGPARRRPTSSGRAVSPTTRSDTTPALDSWPPTWSSEWERARRCGRRSPTSCSP